MNRIPRILFVFIAAAFIAMPSFAFAAEFYFGHSTGSGVERLDVFVNTQGAEINSVGGKVVFANPVKISSLSDGGSIVSLWVKRPAVEDGSIIFSGIIPGGYESDQGLLFSIFFASDAAADTIANISEPEMLLNDGKGTAAETAVKPATISISPTTQEPKLFSSDNDQPETFVPEITQDPNVFNGKWFLVFAAQDKGSGIDHYEVKEGRNSFALAESPFVLADQSLSSDIQIKAVDRNGNVRSVTVSAFNPPHIYQKIPFYAILMVIIVLAIWANLRKGHEHQT